MSENLSEKVPVYDYPFNQHWWVIDEIEVARDIICSAGNLSG